MLSHLLKLARRLDPWLFLSMVFLMAMGLLLHYGLVVGGEEARWDYFYRQAFYVILSVIGFFLFAKIDYRFFRGNSRWWLSLGVVLLLMVLLFGQTIRGASGWFRIGPVQFQPVEFVKILTIVVLANFFSRYARNVKQWRYVILSGVGVWGLVVLLVFQPDLGSAAILLLTWLGMLMLVGLRKRQVAAILVSALTLGLLIWTFFLHDYQKSRLEIFFHPDRAPLVEGYNARQALLAVGSGQLVGRGLGFGSQSQLRFLPEARTDFIFAVLAEELGFLGVSVLLLTWLLLIMRLLSFVFVSHDDFAIFVLVGAIILLVIQVGVNVGMNMGLVPVTGITLPFVSFGGSSMLATAILLGLSQSIRWRQLRPAAV